MSNPLRAESASVCRLRSYLGSGAAMLACSLALAGATEAEAQGTTVPAASAQEDAREAARTGEIIVTAQRRSERLQDVPIAISALNTDALEQRNVQSVLDLQGNVPGLSFSGFGGINGVSLISLRGVAGQPAPIGASQATAVYLDGVYLSKPDAGVFGLKDVERIEVLRGPQGTLYGRNATAGAINIITRQPSDTFDGALDVSYGNYDTINAGGFVSGPLGEHFAASFSGSANRSDGFYINTVTGNRVGRLNPFDLDLRIAVNGEEWASSSTRDPHWRFSDFIAQASMSQTIRPGEIFSTGCTPWGCASEIQRVVGPGDVIDLTVEGIGTLRTTLT